MGDLVKGRRDVIKVVVWMRRVSLGIGVGRTGVGKILGDVGTYSMAGL